MIEEKNMINKKEAYLCFKTKKKNDRYIEIWNNVLSQFNATEGLSREEYPELPHKKILIQVWV